MGEFILNTAKCPRCHTKIPKGTPVTEMDDYASSSNPNYFHLPGQESTHVNTYRTKQTDPKSRCPNCKQYVGIRRNLVGNE